MDRKALEVQERKEQEVVEWTEPQHFSVATPRATALDFPVLADDDGFFDVVSPALAVLPVPFVEYVSPAPLVMPAPGVEYVSPASAVISIPAVAEQVIDFPVPGRGGGACGGLQGLPQGQVSTASAGEQTIVPSGAGLHGFSPGQGSTSVSSAERFSERIMEQIVDIPRGGFPGFSPGHGSTAVCGAEHAIIPVPLGRGGLGDGGFHDLSQGQGSTAFCEAEHVDISVPHVRGKLGDGVFSASSAGAADEGPVGRGSGMGKARFTGYLCISCFVFSRQGRFCW